MQDREEDQLPDLKDEVAGAPSTLLRSQVRVDARGMTRPPSDPSERKLLEATGQLGQFVEALVEDEPRDARDPAHLGIRAEGADPSLRSG